MLPNVEAEITNCYDQARQARKKAEIAMSEEFRAEFLATEQRWLALAYGYQQQQTFVGVDSRREIAQITRLLRAEAGAFDPSDLATLTAAYEAVLHQLNLADRQDGITLMIAKKIIRLASQGEHDPERLMAKTIDVLTSSTRQA